MAAPPRKPLSVFPCNGDTTSASREEVKQYIQRIAANPPMIEMRSGVRVPFVLNTSEAAIQHVMDHFQMDNLRDVRESVRRLLRTEVERVATGRNLPGQQPHQVLSHAVARASAENPSINNSRSAEQSADESADPNVDEIAASIRHFTNVAKSAEETRNNAQKVFEEAEQAIRDLQQRRAVPDEIENARKVADLQRKVLEDETAHADKMNEYRELLDAAQKGKK